MGLGIIHARNDLPSGDPLCFDVDFSTIITLGSDPHVILKCGEAGDMGSDRIKPDHSYAVRAQVKRPLSRDLNLEIDNVKEGQVVHVVYENNQYLLKIMG